MVPFFSTPSHKQVIPKSPFGLSQLVSLSTYCSLKYGARFCCSLSLFHPGPCTRCKTQKAPNLTPLEGTHLKIRFAPPPPPPFSEVDQLLQVWKTQLCPKSAKWGDHTKDRIAMSGPNVMWVSIPKWAPSHTKRPVFEGTLFYSVTFSQLGVVLCGYSLLPWIDTMGHIFGAHDPGIQPQAGLVVVAARMVLDKVPVLPENNGDQTQPTPATHEKEPGTKAGYPCKGGYPHRSMVRTVGTTHLCSNLAGIRTPAKKYLFCLVSGKKGTPQKQKRKKGN